MPDTKRSPEEILEVVRAIAEKASPAPWSTVGSRAVRHRLDSGEYSVLALFERVSWMTRKKLPRKANTQLAALAPTVVLLLEAVVMVMADVECYCLDEPENAGRGPCARCQAGEAMRAVDAALGEVKQ